eukprot:g77453.t1
MSCILGKNVNNGQGKQIIGQERGDFALCGEYLTTICSQSNLSTLDSSNDTEPYASSVNAGSLELPVASLEPRP